MDENCIVIRGHHHQTEHEAEIERLRSALSEIVNSDASQYADDEHEMIYCLQHIASAALNGGKNVHPNSDI